MKKIGLIVALAVVAVAGYFLFVAPKSEENSAKTADKSAVIGEVAAEVAAKEAGMPRGDSAEPGAVVDSDSEAEEDESLTEEEKREREEERLVDEFDAETDKWMDAEKTTPPTMEQVNAFRDKFKKLPKDRKDECIHRALNLVPDENVMLLVGILMDKSEDKEIVETVYNDILNRDEEVKKPILQTIFQDKEHPCWVDTAWILDVTGELPKKK